MDIGVRTYAELVFKPLLFCFPLFICFPLYYTFYQSFNGDIIDRNKKVWNTISVKITQKPSVFSCVCSSLYGFCV
jgi:ABC-type sulfate transport system permease component